MCSSRPRGFAQGGALDSHQCRGAGVGVGAANPSAACGRDWSPRLVSPWRPSLSCGGLYSGLFAWEPCSEEDLVGTSAHPASSTEGGTAPRATPKNPWNAFQARLAGTRLSRKQGALLYREERAALRDLAVDRDVKAGPARGSSQVSSTPASSSTNAVSSVQAEEPQRG